jgi:hypothetical protein
MPWTFVHPAAVLPLRRYLANRHLFGAVVVGSVSPDFGYYVGRFDMATSAHTLLGLLTVCLPTGLALLVIIRMLHRPVANLLPQPHRQAILSLPRMPQLGSLITVLYVSASIILGAVTHNIWDSFTHRAGYVVARWPPLQMPAFILGTKTIRVFEVLQHASTTIGLIVVAAVYLRWLRSTDHGATVPSSLSDGWRYSILVSLTVISLVLSIPVAHAVSATSVGPVNITRFLVRYVICATTIFGVTLSAASLLIAHRNSRLTIGSSDRGAASSVNQGGDQ